MTKIYELLIRFIIKPLVEKGIMAIFNWAKEKKADRKRKKESAKKLKAHKEAKTKKEKQDTFNEMP